MSARRPVAETLARRLGVWPVFAVALLTACGEPPPPPEPALRPVRSVTVRHDAGVLERTLSGVARADLESQLSFRVSGTVEAIRVTVGNPVRAGQEIARLDDTDYRLRLREAEAARAQAIAGQRRADADYDRVRGLYENNNAAKSDLDAARAQAESSRAQVRAAEQRLEMAVRQLGYTRLLAPFAGAVVAKQVEVNENVQAGAPVVRLTAATRPQVEVAVPEALIGALRVGDPVTVTFDAVPGVSFDGEIVEVGVAATGAGGTFPVTARLLGDDTGAVRVGMVADVGFRLPSGAGDARIVVPAVAVGEDRAGRFVFVLEAAAEGRGVVHRRAVAVGAFRPDGIEILDGLEAGERVVTAGVRRLVDGMAVRLQDEAPS